MCVCVCVQVPHGPQQPAGGAALREPAAGRGARGGAALGGGGAQAPGAAPGRRGCHGTRFRVRPALPLNPHL